jgi:FAD/FMN-containing dehydrogenase
VSPADVRFELRTTWENHLGNQSVDPLRIYEPETIEQVAAIVAEARETGATVRAVGSGHSWSDVALTTGFLVKTDGLCRAPAPEPDFLRSEWSGRRLVRAEAGIRIRELNSHLEREGSALSNMGGYDHQTVAGVISTSTHGSGITFGPLNDFVRSLDLVAGDGRVYRIEELGDP